jgi:hypothetical protein
VIVVAGDATLDWNLSDYAEGVAPAVFWNGELESRISFQPGGAYLLSELLRRAVEAEVHSSLVQPEDRAFVRPDSPWYNHSTAIWGPHRRSPKSASPVWRVREFKGLARRHSCDRQPDGGSAVVDDPEYADIVVLDDAALGFRDELADVGQSWPRALSTESRGKPWVVLKTAWPIAEGKLTDYLLDHFADRLLVVTTVNDVRRSDVQISSGLSWEASAQDLTWELTYNPKLNRLSRAEAVIVSFGPAGLWISRRKAESAPDGQPRVLRDSRVMFDHNLIEGAWERDRPGGLIGYTMCLTAGIVKSIATDLSDPEIMLGLGCGIAAMQVLHETGYVDESDGNGIAFPFDNVLAALEDSHEFSVADVPLPNRAFTIAGFTKSAASRESWSILHDRYGTRAGLDRVAEQVVILGPEHVLKDVPLGRFGLLVTADRGEIEGFRAISNVVDEYCRAPHIASPLSIAVFGPPGSGKSFGVTQVAKSLHPGLIRPITFNLSQFGDPDDLIDALHQVRDIGLSGQLPLVFWDEFDTTLGGMRLGWLRLFLAPMQDGEFQQGQITHPIGRAIFVFAGGTVPRLDDLGKRLAEDPDENLKAWKAAKGPDFVSRLRGYINIKGPNRQPSEPAAEDVESVRPDPLHLVRRAILLRSVLERNAPQLRHPRPDGAVELAIDRGLLRAFLGVWAYKHGVRSMESIVGMSLLAGRTSFQRSSLPAKEQLSLHVDGDEFLGLLMQQVQFEGALLEQLAIASHEVYRLEQKGKETPPPLALLTYDELEEAEKEVNRDSVRGIAYKLASIGYVYAPAPEPGSIPMAPIPEDQVEALGQVEHDRWIIAKIDQGYMYGPTRNDGSEPKTHPDLVPWRAMDGEELAARYPALVRSRIGPGPLQNETDRKMVRNIPAILAKAGLMLIRVEDA